MQKRNEAVVKNDPIGRIVCASLLQTLTIYCVLAVFPYSFHLSPESLQETSFHSVKSSLSKGEKPYLAD